MGTNELNSGEIFLHAYTVIEGTLAGEQNMTLVAIQRVITVKYMPRFIRVAVHDDSDSQAVIQGVSSTTMCSDKLSMQTKIPAIQ